MRKTILASMLALAALAVGSEAQAAGKGWGLHSGETVRSGDNLVYGEVGWPDFSFGLQHGMSDKVDVGVRLSLDYGYLYTLNSHLGLGLRAPIRLSLAKGPKVSAYFHLDPGIKFSSFNFVQFGIQVPLGFEIGIHLTPDATLQFGADIPFFLNLTNGVFANIPVLIGPGFDYKIDDHMDVGLNMRFGPDIFAGNGAGFFGGGCGRFGGCSYSGAGLGLIAQVYFGYRL